MTMRLRQNQVNALEISKNNDFSSGIHYHATGTGKSLIGLNIISEYNKKYPTKNILWICERKNILEQQFDPKNTNNKNILKNFIILSFTSYKNKTWFNSLNTNKFWNKPFLCIINRAFLTSKESYKKIKTNIDLIIHDECHSIENKTTQEFYKWINNYNLTTYNISTKIIGLSATPELIEPLDKILSEYNIYDGFKDNVILPPKIIWYKNIETFNNQQIIDLIKIEVNQLHYKKIIVWCGIIDECIKTATLWKSHFEDYNICLDFNNMDKKKYNFNNYEHFYKSKSKSILFCAVKHREGSDIPYLDGCIFMDLVEKRSHRVFVQCIGRVLRKDIENNKKYGLVIDLKAKSTINICNRIQFYLNLKNIFPWNYNVFCETNNNKQYIKNELIMTIKDNIDTTNTENNEKIYTKKDICNLFVRPIPDDDIYKIRLDNELELIQEKKLFNNFVKALDILDLTKNIPHVTRGSCGSSLVCYLLGISHVDPILYNISFARFLNIYRDNLPDIDFDFPHYLRDEVFLKLFQKWGSKIARISNHNYYHEKSALRESLRINGINKFIGKDELLRTVYNLEDQQQTNIFNTQKELEGTFKGYSLHCGGIIYFPKGIPDELILDKKKKSILQQVNLNKYDVAENKNFKIDILSSRALSQLFYCNNYNLIDFNQHIGDTKTIELLSSGNNIGITLAESPLMRKALLLIQPKCVYDLAICLALIRPAAKNTKKEFEIGNYNSTNMIFDDDVIHIISKLLECTEAMGDKIRRKLSKNYKNNIQVIKDALKNKSSNYKNKILQILSDINKYGFCKSHALSYAQLVWQLAYNKAHNPKQFWKSTLKHTKSQYRKWVHLYEARYYDVKPNNTNKSIYSLYKNMLKNSYTPFEYFKKYNYWNMNTKHFYPDCYYFSSNNNYFFKGLIASHRCLYHKNKKLILFVGVDTHKYIEVIINNVKYFNNKFIIVKGKGQLINSTYNTIECDYDNIKLS